MADNLTEALKAQIVPQYNDLPRPLTSVKIRQSATVAVPRISRRPFAPVRPKDINEQHQRHGDVIGTRHTFHNHPNKES